MCQGGQGSQVPVITRRGSWSGEPSQPREAMGGPRVVGPCLQGNEGTSGRSTPRHTPGFQTRGQSSRRDEGDGPCPKPSSSRGPAARCPSCLLPVFLAGWEGQQAGRAGGAGRVPQQPLPRHTLMHMHTHAPRWHAPPPRSASADRQGLHFPAASPSQQGRNPPKCGLWRPQAKLGWPQGPWPSWVSSRLPQYPTPGST